MARLRTLGWRALVAYGAIAFIITSMLPVAALGAPMVRIIRPTDGAVVSAKTTIDVAFKSDTQRPISRLEIYVDDALQIQWNLTTPKLEGWQSFAWDFSFASATTHRIAARAIDSAGSAGATAITVSVTHAQANGGAVPTPTGGTAPAATGAPGGVDTIPPVIYIYYPAQGAHVAKKIDIKADATDNVGVKSVYFYIDGKLHTVIINSPPYVGQWDTTRTTDGPHVLQAKALDAADNEGESSEVTVIVENHNMTVNGGNILPGGGQLSALPGGAAPALQNPLPAAAPAYQALPATPAAPPVGAPDVVAPAAVPGPAPVVAPTPSVTPQTPENVTPGTVNVTPGATNPVPGRAEGTKIARGDVQKFGASAPALSTPSYAMSLAPADPIMGATSVLSDRIAGSLSGIRTTTPEGTWAAPMAAASVDRGGTLTSAWDGGLLAAATPDSTGPVSVLRTTLPGDPASLSAPTGAEPEAPGTVARAADIAPRYAAAPGALRTSLPDLALPAADMSVQRTSGERASGEREEMTPSGATIATVPGSEANGFAPQRTSIPDHSSIHPISETAAAQLARAEVMSVQPVLVFRPQEMQIAAVGSDAGPRLSTPGGGSSPLAVRQIVPATPAELAHAPASISSRAATAPRPPTRLALLPRTSDERMTLPAMQPFGSPLATTATTTASLKALKVMFNDRELALRARPELQQGVPMTALREIFEKTDGVLYWYPITKTVRAVNSKTDVRLKIGSKQATVNQQAKTLEIAPYLKCGRTMVPLQFIADTLDVTVKYDPANGQIVITSNQF